VFFHVRPAGRGKFPTHKAPFRDHFVFAWDHIPINTPRARRCVGKGLPTAAVLSFQCLVPDTSALPPSHHPVSGIISIPSTIGPLYVGLPYIRPCSAYKSTSTATATLPPL
jgi:hypothetical protein